VPTANRDVTIVDIHAMFAATQHLPSNDETKSTAPLDAHDRGSNDAGGCG
jgi:hypothetical protein